MVMRYAGLNGVYLPGDLKDGAGCVGAIARGEAAVCADPVGIMASRLRDVSFTLPFRSTYIGYNLLAEGWAVHALKKADKLLDDNIYIHVLPPYTHGLNLLCTFAYAAAFFLLDRRRYRYFHYLWEATGSFFREAQSIVGHSLHILVCLATRKPPLRSLWHPSNGSFSSPTSSTTRLFSPHLLSRRSRAIRSTPLRAP